MEWRFWIHSKDYFDFQLLYGKHASWVFFRVGLWSHFASSLKMNGCDQSWPFWSALLVIYRFVFLLRLYYNKPMLSLYSGGNGCTRTATTPLALLKATTSSAGDTPPLKGYYLQWPQAALPGSSSGGIQGLCLPCTHPSKNSSFWWTMTCSSGGGELGRSDNDLLL